MDSNVKEIPAVNDSSVPETRMDTVISANASFDYLRLLLSVVKLHMQKNLAVRICAVPKNRAAPQITYTNKSSQKQTKPQY